MRFIVRTSRRTGVSFGWISSIFLVFLVAASIGAIVESFLIAAAFGIAIGGLTLVVTAVLYPTRSLRKPPARTPRGGNTVPTGIADATTTPRQHTVGCMTCSVRQHPANMVCVYRDDDGSAEYQCQKCRWGL